MEKTLQKIANLSILNLQNIVDLGLLRGKMGIVIFLYHYARHASKPAYSDQADELLDELFAALHGILPPSFADGVAGIGFGLNYLIRNRFIETDDDLDELFKEVDNQLLGTVQQRFSFDTRTDSTSLPLSIGLYALSRIKTGQRTPSKNKLVSTLLVEIQTIYKNGKQLSDRKLIAPSFTSSVIYCLFEIHSYGFYKKKVEKILKMVLSFVDDSFDSTSYCYADANILKSILCPIEPNWKLANKILIRLEQLNLPSDNSDIDSISQKSKQYIFYPNVTDSHLSESSIEEYVNDYMSDLSTSDLLSFAYIGLDRMNVKLI